jgi:hypothetical protein
VIEGRRRKLPLWTSLVDRALQSAAATGKPVVIEAALDSVGIFRWSKYRLRAVTYAKKVIAAKSGDSHESADYM